MQVLEVDLKVLVILIRTGTFTSYSLMISSLRGTAVGLIRDSKVRLSGVSLEGLPSPWQLLQQQP